MSLNDAYWNPQFESWMRVTSTGVLERLESGIIVPPTRRKKDANIDWDYTERSAPWTRETQYTVESEELREELRRKRWIPVRDEDHIVDKDGIPTTKSSLISNLMNTYHRQHKSSDEGGSASKKQKQEWNATSEDFKRRLSILSLLELRDAEQKLRSTPFSERKGHRDHIENYLSEREDKLFGENGAYPNEIEGLHISNLRTLLIGEDENTATKITRHMVTVKHPKAGRVNLYKDKKNNWQVFDGLAEYDKVIKLDGVRSLLLEKLKLAPHINEIISILDASEGKIDRSRDAIMVQDVDTFNKLFNDVTHVPAPDMEPETESKIKDLAEDLIADDKKYFEVDVKDARPEALFLAANPVAALSILNDLTNSSVTSIMQLMTGMYKHSYLSSGHSDVPNNASTFFQILDNMNNRGDPREGHPVTGYQRPVNISGGLIPYKGMSFREKNDFRQHFADLHDRPKAWIQHTPEGKETYDVELDNVKERFDWDEFVKEVGEDQFFVPSLAEGTADPWMALSEIINSDGTFKDVEEGLDIPLLELLPRLDEIYDPDEEGEGELVRDVLSKDQLAAIDHIMRSDDRRLAYGVVDREEGLAKKFKEDTFNVLLGDPVIPAPEDWTRYDESGSDTGEMYVTKFGGSLPIDELHKHRVGGLLEIIAPDDERFDGATGKEIEAGDYRMIYSDEDYPEGAELRLPNALASTKKNEEGQYQHVMNFDDFLDQSILDQFVKDGVLPKEGYASSTDIEAREGVPPAPEFGGDLCIARVNFISNRLRDFQKLMPRGYDNETGFYQYKLDPKEPQAELTKQLDYKGRPKSIMNVLYDDLNNSEVLGIEKGQLSYVPDDVRAEAASIKEQIADGESPPIKPPPTDDRGVPMDEESDAYARRHEQLEQELRRLGNTTTDERVKKGLSDAADSHEQIGDAIGINFTEEDLLNSPDYQAYQEAQRDRQAYEVLANAPLDVRVTAYRMRIQGLQDRLDEATTMGEAYDIARDWVRVGIVEYPDILPIDRDGSSKFRKVSNALENVGVDWLEVNEEWVGHQNMVREHGETLDALQEQINYLNETFPDMENGDDESVAASRLKEKFEFDQRNLREKGTPEFGSQAHVDILHDSDPKVDNDPARLQAYADRENTPIGKPDLLTTSVKGTKNALTGALAAGLATWREMRLYGMNVISSGLHAAMSTIGEGTGIGADRIRGMDLSKPLEQMPVGYEDSGLRSYFSIGIPGTNVGKRDTVYEYNRKIAGKEGKPYQAPQTQTEEQKAALERVQDTAGRRVIPTSSPPQKMTSTDPDSPSDPTPEDTADIPTPEDTADNPTQDKELPTPGIILPQLRSPGGQKNKASGKRIEPSGKEELPFD